MITQHPGTIKNSGGGKRGIGINIRKGLRNKMALNHKSETMEELSFSQYKKSDEPITTNHKQRQMTPNKVKHGNIYLPSSSESNASAKTVKSDVAKFPDVKEMKINGPENKRKIKKTKIVPSIKPNGDIFGIDEKRAIHSNKIQNVVASNTKEINAAQDMPPNGVHSHHQQRKKMMNIIKAQHDTMTGRNCVANIFMLLDQISENWFSLKATLFREIAL